MEAVLVDMDDTLFDFKKSERKAFFNCMDSLGISASELSYKIFHTVNEELWDMQKKGLICAKELMIKRFEIFLREIHCEEKYAKKINQEFLNSLAEQSECVDGAADAIRDICKIAPVYIVTNGVSYVQKKRLKNSVLQGYITALFVSEEIGYEKPEPGFFSEVQKQIGGNKNYLMIGDSLQADIFGGIRQGYCTVWYNPKMKENTLKIYPDFTAESWSQIKNICNVLDKQ